MALPPIDDHVRAVERLADTYDHVLVEGAGGLLVHLDGQRHTPADLAGRCTHPSAAVRVCRAGLGTLNHTELSLEALDRREIPVLGVLIGSWPRRASEIDESNRAYLAAVGANRIAPGTNRTRESRRPISPTCAASYGQ